MTVWDYRLILCDLSRPCSPSDDPEDVDNLAKYGCRSASHSAILSSQSYSSILSTRSNSCRWSFVSAVMYRYKRTTTTLPVLKVVWKSWGRLPLTSYLLPLLPYPLPQSTTPLPLRRHGGWVPRGPPYFKPWTLHYTLLQGGSQTGPGPSVPIFNTSEPISIHMMQLIRRWDSERELFKTIARTSKY